MLYKTVGAVKKGAAPSKVESMLVRTRTDIKLWPSRLEYCHDQYVKTTGKNKD